MYISGNGRLNVLKFTMIHWAQSKAKRWCSKLIKNYKEYESRIVTNNDENVRQKLQLGSRVLSKSDFLIVRLFT